IDVALVDNLIARDLRVEDRELANRTYYCLKDERHEGELRSRALLKLALVTFAQACDASHVYLVNGRHVRARSARERHVLRDLLAHHAHLLNAIFCGGLSDGRRLRDSRSRWRSSLHCLLRRHCSAGFNEAQYVVLRDATAHPRAFEPRD